MYAQNWDFVLEFMQAHDKRKWKEVMTTYVNVVEGVRLYQRTGGTGSYELQVNHTVYNEGFNPWVRSKSEPNGW